VDTVRVGVLVTPSCGSCVPRALNSVSSMTQCHKEHSARAGEPTEGSLDTQAKPVRQMHPACRTLTLLFWNAAAWLLVLRTRSLLPPRAKLLSGCVLATR
jgi:hypothetical protein